jgi:parallel beta-helix repeat protein
VGVRGQMRSIISIDLHLDGSAILDGFTIRDGNANGVFPHNLGGGMYNNQSSPRLMNCTFSDNLSSLRGGGMYNKDSSLTLTNCTFQGNLSDYNGGGMFTNNMANLGGGMSNYGSSPALSDCIFLGNSADYGGGMRNTDSSSPALSNCTITGNSARKNGGGLYHADSTPDLINATFWGNSAVDLGGGIFNSNSSPLLANSILWSDTPEEIFNTDASSAPVVSYSDIQEGYAGISNIDADPLFVDSANRDFHLLSGSPCLDRGNNAAANLPMHDFEGDARILDGDKDGIAVVDMGVDEMGRHLYLALLLRSY